MSRIGRKPIAVPAGVDVKIGEGNVVTVKGPKGTLTEELNHRMTITLEGGVIHVTRPLIRQILGVGGHETDPLQSLDSFYFLQKLCKGNGLFQIFTVGIYILSQQHDLHNAVRHQSLDLTDDILRITAALPATDIRYNTVAAEIIAAEHNIDT